MIRGAGRLAGRFRRQAGLSYFEFFIRAAVVGILAAILLERSLTYQEYGEQTAMEISLRNMRSGLRLRVADLMTRDRMSESAALLEQNPVHWLPPPPPNYLGELRDPDPRQLPPGNWYFDSGRKEMVYLPDRRRHLIIDNPAEIALRFRVQAVKHARPAATGGSNERTEGMALLPVVGYRWNW